MSSNNVIVIINFLSIVLLLSYELLVFNCIEITLLIVLIYSSALLCLFLVNGILLMSGVALALFPILSHYATKLLVPIVSSAPIQLHYISLLLHYAIMQSCTHYYSINMFIAFPCIWSTFLNYSFSRFGNLVFDNSTLTLIVLLFLVAGSNIKTLSIKETSYVIGFLIDELRKYLIFLL